MIVLFMDSNTNSVIIVKLLLIHPDFYCLENPKLPALSCTLVVKQYVPLVGIVTTIDQLVVPVAVIYGHCQLGQEHCLLHCHHHYLAKCLIQSDCWQVLLHH
jgi:hypothetical protein